ncbi:MAG: DEAD/DEAH box helicase [Ardenticatenales bacterium]|nr:DEAD/DEAH box helicase [Ardenticatenales bacterium]
MSKPPPPRFVVPVDDLWRSFVGNPRFAPNLVAVRDVAARPAEHAPWPPALAPVVAQAAARRGIDRPYRHQAAAIAAALAPGESPVAVATGTASGKSLCFTAPILDALVRDPGARALCLFPTKALAQDQLAALHGWQDALDAAALDAGDAGAVPPRVVLAPATYDGDTPQAMRGRIRAGARIVLTNPDMLHTGLLPHHTSWSSFLAGLRYVVIDEIHVYRGVFGSHVANVLRRLRRVAAFHGAAPRFVLLSATIANPAELAEALAGGAPSLIDDDGAPNGRRLFACYNPPIVDAALNLRRGVVAEAEPVARHFLAGGVQTIVFARARQTAELLVRLLGGGGGPTVRGYRGGYTATERRAIEADLRDGRLRGVVATNALELGIDIGELDACVMMGYPGSIASARQQAGRVGRRTGTAVAVLIAGGSPLDQFIVRHPDYLFDRSPEEARLDPDNLRIVLEHVRCAAFELPFGAEEAARPFGAPPGATGGVAVGDLLAVLEADGSLSARGGTWYWLADRYPAEGVNLRGAASDVVAIVRQSPARDGLDIARQGAAAPAADAVDAADDGALPARPDILGTIDRSRAPLVVHTGAVYLHDGTPWRVEALDWEAGRAFVVPADGATYTRGSARVDVEPILTAAERDEGPCRVGYGELEVRSKPTSYRELRFSTNETIGWGTIDLPESAHVAGGYWFTLDEACVERLRAIGRWDFDPSGDRGPNWPVQRVAALARDGHRCRLCGAAPRPGRTHDVHHLRPFRLFGWLKGSNENYRLANDLDNLITLCPACHRLAERALGLHGALSGVGYALGHIAPLLLMCDAADLGVTTTAHAPWSKRPTVVVYEQAGGGVGFGEVLWRRHAELIALCTDLVEGCRCTWGCPSCVGPGEPGGEAKRHARAVLGVLGGGGTGPAA